MTTGELDDGTSEPQQPVALTDWQLGRLRKAAGWARVVAIGALTAAGLAAGATLVFPEQIIRSDGGVVWSQLISVIVFCASTIGAAVLLSKYGRNVTLYLTGDPPALTRAFRHLRHFFMLWTFAAGFAALMQFLSVWKNF